MPAPPTLLLIADIAGYTRFLKMHQMSLVHAQDIVARLLEAVIDAAEPGLKLAKLEGDAAFFYSPVPMDEATLARHSAAIFHAFHAKSAAPWALVSTPPSTAECSSSPSASVKLPKLMVTASSSCWSPA